MAMAQLSAAVSVMMDSLCDSVAVVQTNCTCQLWIMTRILYGATEAHTHGHTGRDKTWYQ